MLPEWQIDGQISPRYEYYDAFGNKAASPYPFLDSHWFTDFNVNAFRRVSPYETFRATVFGAFNDSDYRNFTEKSWLFERATIAWEKGDAPIPFRVKAGDYFAFLSLRTLQVPLKGGMVEFQPAGDATARYSLLLFSGVPSANYRDLDKNISWFSGASALLSHAALGDYSVNVVYNSQFNLEKLPRQNQLVSSVAGERSFQILGQRLVLEAEVSHFRGDQLLSDLTLARDRNSMGYFVLLSGRGDTPLTYSFLYEQYGQFFQPAGAAITSNRETIEGRAGWRFENGLRLNGRLQQFRDGLDNTHATTTRTAGVNLTGPYVTILGASVTGALDAFVQKARNRGTNIDTRIYSVNFDLISPLGPDTTGRLSLSYQDTDDKFNESRTITRQTIAALDRRIDLFGVTGVFSPGMVVRWTTGGTSRQLEWGPTASLSLTKGGHALSGSYTLLVQDGHASSAVNTSSHTGSLSYTYTIGSHTFGVYGDAENREVDPGHSVRSYRVGAFYTLRFNKPSRVATRPARPGITPAGFDLDLLTLRPGITLAEAMRLVAGADITGPVQLPGVVVYQARILPRIDQRQRLALAHRNGRLVRSAIIIDFDNVGDLRSAEQLFARVRADLARRYGAPATFELGPFTGDLRTQVNADRLIRLAEWQTVGGVLRLGIPRRLDRQVRIEIQYAPSFPSQRQTNWSIEEVR